MASRRRGARARHVAVRGARRVAFGAPAVVLLVVVTALVAVRTSPGARGNDGDHGDQAAALAAAALTPDLAGAVNPSVAPPASPSATRSASPRVSRSASPRPSPSSVPSPAPPPVRSVVALGDSVPAGSGCDCTPYVGVVAADLARAQGTTVASSNDAVPGQTSEGLLAGLDQPDVRDDVRDADLVVVEIGANDFDASVVTSGSCSSAACYQDDLAALRTRLGRILDTVRGLAGDDAEIVLTGYWNVFLDGAVGRAQGQDYVENSDALTRATNAAVEAAARGHGAIYVDVYGPFKADGSKDDTPLLAADGDHPSAQGHRVIASAITTAVASRES